MKTAFKTGDSSRPKHGRLHQTTHKTSKFHSKTHSDQLKLIGFNSDGGDSRESVVDHGCGDLFSTVNGDVVNVLPSSSKLQTYLNLTKLPSVKVEHSLDEDDLEKISSQGLEWLKANVQSEDLDILELANKTTSSSVSMMADATAEFSENDFVFATTLPDSTAVKQNHNNYFAAMENGDYSTSVSTPHMTWNSSQTINVQNSGLGHLSVSTEPFVSFPDDALEESVNNGNTISCNTSDLNSILFDNINNDINKSDSLSVEIMQYSNFAVDRNLMCSEELVGSFNTISSSDIKTLPLAFSGAIVDQVSLPNLHDNSSDLSLNSLPNFLGLDNTSTNVSTSGSFNDGSSVSILEGGEQSLSLESQTVTSAQSLQHQLLHGIGSSELKNENVSVTTISISNDDENSTKILVDSYQGKQQMYVINTADLNKSHGMGQGNMFVINASDLRSANNAFSISALKQGVTVTSQPIGTQAAGIPGFVLMPMVDSTTNVIQAVPIQIADVDPNSKRPKKMLMCAAPGCRKTFKKASKLKVHQMLHTGERPFKIDRWGITQLQKSYNFYRLALLPKREQFTAPLTRQIDYIDAPGNLKCSLLGCDWAFTTSNKLKRHMESHEGRKDYMCDQPGCGHRFTTVYNLNTHRKLHDRPCTETCTEDGCHLRFATKRQLEVHLRNVHSCEDRTFKCPEPDCEKVFFSSGCMGSHMKIHQQNQEELRCKVAGCGKEFSKMCRLRQHERLHSGEKPFVCNYQGCNWAFAVASKLKRHQTKHTGQRKWICEVCKKQFHRSEHLKGHLITHSGDRPFICPVEGCGNTFTAKSSLYVHLKKHDESGKTIVYHCPMEKCDRHYANKASLRQHIMVKHCNLPQQKGGTEGNNQGVVSWLSLLSSGDANGDIGLSQESYGEGLAQTALTPSQDSVLPTDFLTGGNEDLSGHQGPKTMTCQNCPNFKFFSANEIVSRISSDAAPSLATEAEVPLNAQQHLHQPQQQQPMLSDDEIDPRLLEAGEILQQQERMSFEAVEIGKKSQIVFENMNGSARTDPRSNDILSHRAVKRWQKQKEIEAAKLRAKLDAPMAASPSNSSVMNASGDYKNPVSSNVSLAGEQHQRPSSLSRSVSTVKAEVIDMEPPAEGLPGSSMSASMSDSFMTELFIRDPETGMTYRQTQLLQDDPPNPEMMEDMEGVTSLDPSLDSQFMEDSLNFPHLQ